jgi:hypothetical protein
VEQKLPARSQKSLVFLKSLFFGQWEIWSFNMIHSAISWEWLLLSLFERCPDYRGQNQ